MDEILRSLSIVIPGKLAVASATRNPGNLKVSRFPLELVLSPAEGRERRVRKPNFTPWLKIYLTSQKSHATRFLGSPAKKAAILAATSSSKRARASRADQAVCGVTIKFSISLSA